MTATYNLADLFESVVDAIPDREALVVGDRRLTYAQLDERASRLANYLASRGIGAGSHVGLLLANGTEYLEGMLACFKLSAVPINVNYRYVESELAYLFTDAKLQGLIAHRRNLETATPVIDELDDLIAVMVVEDGSAAGPELRADRYEDALAGSSAARPDATRRSSDDIYIVYTGGTTGMPKGVMWRHEDIFFAAMGGGDLARMDNFITSPTELPERLQENSLVALPTPPLMHASAHWLSFHQLFTGGKVVLAPLGRFDAKEIWSLIEAEGVFMLIIVGDAMAAPLIDELTASPDAYKTDTLWVVGSGGAILSAANRERILALLPNRLIADGYGSSETGTMGSKTGQGGATFVVNAQSAVLGEDGKPVGVGETGRLARRGYIPLGYYGDEEKTAKTFVTMDGVRWVLPGDLARVEEDGSITLLGRGSTSINTGGEKVFPEEVEAPLKGHPAIADVVVVGALDERWGQRVVALIEPRPGRDAPDLAEVKRHLAGKIASYKIPREVVAVPAIQRTAAGKVDVGWARGVVA